MLHWPQEELEKHLEDKTLHRVNVKVARGLEPDLLEKRMQGRREILCLAELANRLALQNEHPHGANDSVHAQAGV